MSLPGRKKFLLFSLMLFGPGILLFLLSRGQQNFNYLDKIAETNTYQFYDLDSNLITSETNEYEIIIFTTIQNSCFDNTNKICSIYPYFMEEFFYNDYEKAPKKYEGVKIYSIVTDMDGNATAPDSLLIETFQKYNPEYWELLIGDPKQVYGFEKEGQLFTEVTDEEGNLEFMKMGMVVTNSTEIKAIRPLNGEAFARELSERFRMIIKEKDIKEYNEMR